jgi:hypothetical protein
MQTSVMTTDYASYILLIMAILFIVLALIFHKGYFFITSTFCWTVYGIYVFAKANGDMVMGALGLLAFIMAIVCVVLLVALRPKEVDVVKQVAMEHKQKIARQAAEMQYLTPDQKTALYHAEMRRRRYSGRPGYDEQTGNRTGSKW